jgi:hypothetical protein
MLVRALGIALVVLPGLAALPRTSARSDAPQSPFGDVTLTVTPIKFKGACPVRLHFFGRVGVTVHPMVFNYHFERSDGAKGQLKVIRVTNPNAQIIGVHDWWQLGAAGQHYTVWERLYVASGNTRITSNQAEVDITCQ